MSLTRSSLNPALHFFIAGLSIAVLVLLVSVTGAQEARPAGAAAKSAANAPANAAVARGKYIVEDVAMCGNCHTPRLPNGDLDNSRWLAGASVPYLPARPEGNWPIMAPRIAGRPPATDAQMITLLTTAIWVEGKPLRDPMPHFHMTRADAEAVLAYLKSLAGGREQSQ